MEYPGGSELSKTNTSIIDFEREFDDLNDTYDAIQEHNESDEQLPEEAEQKLQEFGRKLIRTRKAYVKVIRLVKSSVGKSYQPAPKAIWFRLGQYVLRCRQPWLVT